MPFEIDGSNEPSLDLETRRQGQREAITQAQLDRMTRPALFYLAEVVRWTRQFRTYDNRILEDVIQELTPQVAQLGANIRNPPEWWTLANWQDCARTLDEKQARCDAATRTLGRRS